MEPLQLLKVLAPVVAALVAAAALVTDFKKEGKMTQAGRWALVAVLVAGAFNVAIAAISGDKEAAAARKSREQAAELLQQATNATTNAGEASRASKRAATLSESALNNLHVQANRMGQALAQLGVATDLGSANLETTRKISTEAGRILHPIRQVELSFSARVTLQGSPLEAFRKRLDVARTSQAFERYLPIVGAEQEWFLEPPRSGALAADLNQPPGRIYFFENSPVFPGSDDDVMVKQVADGYRATVRFYKASGALQVMSGRAATSSSDLDVIFGRRPEDGGHSALLYDSTQGTVELHIRWVTRGPLHPAWQSHGGIVSLPDLRNGLVVVEATDFSYADTPRLAIRIDGALYLDSLQDFQRAERKDDAFRYYARLPDVPDFYKWMRMRDEEREEKLRKQESARIATRLAKFRDGWCDPNGLSLDFIPGGLDSEEAYGACSANLSSGKVPSSAFWDENALFGGAWRWDVTDGQQVQVRCACSNRQ